MTRWIPALFVLAACGDRHPVYQPGDDGYGYELPEADGECSVDLQCMTNGCGNHCTATSAEVFAGACILAPHVEVADCGCVDTRCQWYTGDPVSPLMLE